MKSTEKVGKLYRVSVGGSAYFPVAEGIVEAIAVAKCAAAEDGLKDLEVRSAELVGTGITAAGQRALAGVG